MLSVAILSRPVTSDPRTLQGELATQAGLPANPAATSPASPAFPQVPRDVVETPPRGSGDRPTDSSPWQDRRNTADNRPSPRPSPASAFAAQLLGQQSQTMSVPRRSPYAVAAYQAASGRDAAARTATASTGAVELDHPDFPTPLASGHLLDLVV